MRSPAARTAHPRWLQKALKAAWPEHWEAVCAANNAHPPLILRVNRRHGSRDAYLAELLQAGIAAEPCAFSRDGIRLVEARDVKTLPGFAEGRVSVQDEAAQLATDLLELAPGQRVLDACCAPGGKTCHLLEAEAGLAEVVAVDLEESRLLRVRENLDRLGLEAARGRGEADLLRLLDRQADDRAGGRIQSQRTGGEPVEVRNTLVGRAQRDAVEPGRGRTGLTHH